MYQNSLILLQFVKHQVVPMRSDSDATFQRRLKSRDPTRQSLSIMYEVGPSARITTLTSSIYSWISRAEINRERKNDVVFMKRMAVDLLGLKIYT